MEGSVLIKSIMYSGNSSLSTVLTTTELRDNTKYSVIATVTTTTGETKEEMHITRKRSNAKSKSSKQ